MAGDLKEAQKLLSLAATAEGKPSFLTKLSRGVFDPSFFEGFDDYFKDNKDFSELFSWLYEFLYNSVDPIEIRKNSRVSPEIYEKIGPRLLGAKIDKKYKGLKLSTVEYCLLMRLLSGWSAPLGIWYTANCSIGLSGYLMIVLDSLEKDLAVSKNKLEKEELAKIISRTRWQMDEFFPDLASGANAGFGLTQVTAGSDPMAMINTDTVAEKLGDGTVRVRGHKLYNTNGSIAKYEVIMAPLEPRKKICAFIVPTQGYGKFEIIPCSFAGNRGIDNCLIKFDVIIPESFMIGRDGEGLKNALRTLNTGRLAMAAGSSATIISCLQISRWWCKERIQQKRPIGKYKKNSIRVAKMACDAFAVEAIMVLGSAMYDKHKKDVDMRLETAATKLWSTERAVAAAVSNLNIRSGRGYETYESQALRAKKVDPYEIPLPDDSFIDDANILKIGEGTSDIQQLIISGMAVAPHALRLMPIVNLKQPLRAVLAVVRALTYYGFWIPKRFFLMLWFMSVIPDGDSKLSSHLKYIKYMSNRLALKVFFSMLKYKVGLLKEQIITSFIADQLTELWVMSAVCRYAEKLYSKNGNIVYEIADVHCSYAKYRINGEAENKPHSITDNKAYRLGQKIIFDEAASFLENGMLSILKKEKARWS